VTVLHLLGSRADGGAETYFTQLTSALQAGLGGQAAAIRAHEGRVRALRRAGVPVSTFGFGGPLDGLTRPRLARRARALDARVLVAWMNRAARHAPRGPWRRIGRLGGYYDLKNYKGFDALVGNTADIRDWIVGQGWPAEHAHHVPNFAEAGPEPALRRAALETPEGIPLLLGMGRLHASKAHDVSLRALGRLPDAWLWIAGTGPLEAELKALAAELGVADRVRWLGWRDDASALYRAADVCVFPSRYEPLGNVVIQAWAHGLPVVAAAAKGPAALIEDGVDGRIVPVDHPEALARAVAEMLADPSARAAMAQAGLARAAGEFGRRRGRLAMACAVRGLRSVTAGLRTDHRRPEQRTSRATAIGARSKTADRSLVARVREEASFVRVDPGGRRGDRAASRS
jgi:glycosyltransferase involved in cell wall biosynthesis